MKMAAWVMIWCRRCETVGAGGVSPNPTLRHPDPNHCWS